MGSNRRFNIQQGGGLTAPKISGSNPLEKYILAQNKIMLNQQGQREERGNISQDIETVKQQFGGEIPPGTSLSVGGVTAPLNRELTGEEVAAVASKNVFVPTAEEMKQKTQGGVFQPKMFKGTPVAGNIERTYRQWSATQPNALFTSLDSELQSMQGKYNSIKRYVFGEGGKQLTPYEAGVVMALINATGKSDEQYVNDLDEATRIIEEKARVALGGANAAKSPIPGMNPPQPKEQQQDQSSGRIRVRDKMSGKTGTVSMNSFDPNKYERI